MILMAGEYPGGPTRIIYGAEPDFDNAMAVGSVLQSRGIGAVVTNNITLRPGETIIAIGGPVANQVTAKYNSESPIKFLPTGSKYWPCHIVDTLSGIPLDRNEDGFVSSFKASDGTQVTIIAGCAREGTDLATFKFIDWLNRPSFLQKILPYATGLGLGVLLLKLATTKPKYGSTAQVMESSGIRRY